MKKLLMVLSILILAAAAASSWAWRDSTLKDSSEGVLASSDLGPGEFTEISIPLVGPFEALLRSQESRTCNLQSVDLLRTQAAFYCPRGGCCQYRQVGDCCVPQSPNCGTIPCAVFCSV